MLEGKGLYELLIQGVNPSQAYDNFWGWYCEVRVLHVFKTFRAEEDILLVSQLRLDTYRQGSALGVQKHLVHSKTAFFFGAPRAPKMRFSAHEQNWEKNGALMRQKNSLLIFEVSEKKFCLFRNNCASFLKILSEIYVISPWLHLFFRNYVFLVRHFFFNILYVYFQIINVRIFQTFLTKCSRPNF